MASTSYRMDLVRGNFLSVNSKLCSTRACPISISVKPMFTRCCHQAGESEKKKNKSLKVVGLGSKRNAILDFCLDSPLLQSSSVEFWTTGSGSSEKVQRFRQITGKPSFPIEGAIEEVMDLLVENSMSLGSIIVLVAGTGFNSDDKAATKLLGAIKSNGGLAVSIIMKPFSFEGERRKNQVDKLIVKLAQFSNLSIVVDSDALLKRETVTLTEALRMANNAVLLAIMSVSALLSDSSIKTLHVIPDKSKVIGTSDVLNILQHSGKAVVGFGAGYSVKASVERAAFDCPFLSGGLVQAMKDVVICIIASANIMDKKDIQAAICAFRHITKSSAKVICSTVLESTLEPNVIVSTIIISGVPSPEATPNLNFWSQLSLRIPFPFAQLWGGLSSKTTDSQETVLPKESSWLEETLSMRQTALKNDTLETQTDDLSFSTDYQDESKAFSNCSENKNSGFKPQLPCINTKSAERVSIHSSSGVNGGADNHTATKQINCVSDNQDVVKMDQRFNFLKSSQVTHNLMGEDVPDLDSAQGKCSNNESSHINHDENPNTNIAANNQTKQHQLSSSTTRNSIFTQNCLKDSFSNDMEGNVKGNAFSSITQNERAINIDESSDSQYIDKGLGHWKEDAPGKSNWELPMLDKNSSINSHDTEFVVGHADGSVHAAQLMDKEGLVCWNEELDLSVAEAWAHMQGDLQKKSKVDDWRLPIGVKLVNEKNGNHQAAQGMQIDDSESKIAQDAGLSPWNGLAGAGLSAMMDIYHAASAMVLGNDTEDYRKQGSLSDRAASMLETERGLKRKWSPIVEMQYREGIYRGRCQGGLPEGKGRLSYKDGSFYDGIWKHGKRCGTGAFYYSSGDMFQGYWRDDLMHGKGKANGEGRYYSKDGDVFFGHFENNWRHGKGLYIEPNGTRWSEIWEQGILVHRAPLESKGRST
ncbi:protein ACCUMULATION AND REPLICATION OF CHLOROPLASTS 3, chloroplastic isoform X2 [Cryptomeria japonica]|uniref:protein ACCUMULATION AND REPLICATION OF CHLOROPLASTS 3, chloroplastic isoform X2 n=1 Tax=Cryptomeria japonica TaxID=3369 RepID=UPI0027D9EA36|nr:protein ACCUMULATION AND REPLICATION OF CHLOROPLASTS 3, chloroplastic isoform X2 [Cryptomeria japonica]